MARTTGVRFRQAGKIFYFDAGDMELEVSEYVVVETSHGLAVGRVVISPDQVISNESNAMAEVKPVLRRATPEDIETYDVLKGEAAEAVLLAKKKVSDEGIGMSIASGEFDLDKTQFTAYFTANERVDFRNLVRDLSRDLGTRVQLLQVGDRDRAKLADGFDVCGERLCCSSWMTNFPSVSIRMAKEQDLPLNPQKISGVCGRLYCCLTFEYEDYKALRGTLPKVGSFLSTPSGQARVLHIDFNREMVRLVLTDSGEQIEIAAIDFKLQHGLTIRPMDLVHKVEGGMRTITEDSSSRTQTSPGPRERTSRPPRRDGRQQPPRAGAPGATPPASGPAGRLPARPNSDTPPPAGPSGPRRPSGQRAPRDIVEQAEQVASAADNQPTGNTPATGAEGEEQRKRRRRRRGRGRGKGPGGDAQGGGPGETPPPSE
jgi:cell fate regulator YaaT (PSP1 superfamily)